ncbi:MAG: hypothetical protein IJ325_10385 [Clostridia bacterium]|nr:hypothetical protein [Clostridia bacterium]
MKIRRFLLVCGILLFVVLLCTNADAAGGAFITAMDNFLHKLLPVLFPYMVISRLFISQDLLSSLSLVLPIHKIFRIPAGAAPVFWLGNLCGFPVGAQLTGILYRNGRISAKEASRLCAISGNVSPAFVVQAIGGLLWNNTAFGGFLLTLQFLSCCVVGIFLGRKAGDTVSVSDMRGETEGFGGAFCRAVTESAAGCVSLWGYIVFFSVLLAVIPVGGMGRLVLASLLEFTAGVEEAAAAGGLAGLFFTGFSIGFGGLCVLAQVSHALGKNGISLVPYIGGKCFQGIVCGIGAVLYGLCFPALHKGDTVRSTLFLYTGMTDGIGQFLFPGIVVLLAGMHYLLYFPKNSVKTDDSSV